MVALKDSLKLPLSVSLRLFVACNPYGPLRRALSFVDIFRILWRPLPTEPQKLLHDGRQPVRFGYFCALSRLSDTLGVVYTMTIMGRE